MNQGAHRSSESGSSAYFHSTLNSLSARMPTRGKWLFLGSFLFSCFLFWWLRSILVREVLRLPDPVQNTTIAVSVLAALLFAAGYLFPIDSGGQSPGSMRTLDACSALAYKATVLLFIPAMAIALQLLRSRIGVDYGSTNAIPRLYQAVLYIHLFFAFMYMGAADLEKYGSRKFCLAALLATLPRLIISLHGARFFLAQALVPAFLIAVARGWIRFTVKRTMQVIAVSLALIVVPAVTRGSAVVGPGENLAIIMDSDVLSLYQDNTDLAFNRECPPLFLSLTAKTIPWGMLGVCVLDFAGLKNMPATLDRILTNNDPYSFHGTVAGSGSIYLLELYLSGGIAAVMVGSALFGFSCRLFIGWIGKRSLYSGIWAECLTRALLAPRGNLGYVYERIPSLILATCLVIAFVRVERLLRTEHVVMPIAPAQESSE